MRMAELQSKLVSIWRRPLLSVRPTSWDERCRTMANTRFHHSRAHPASIETHRPGVRPHPTALSEIYGPGHVKHDPGHRCAPGPQGLCFRPSLLPRVRSSRGLGLPRGLRKRLHDRLQCVFTGVRPVRRRKVLHYGHFWSQRARRFRRHG